MSLLALGLLAILPGAVPAPSSTPGPVRIDRCHVSYVGNTHGMALSQTVGPVHLDFTNTGARAISAVTFGIDLLGRTVTVRDTGTFSPHVPIRHLFDVFRGMRAGMSETAQPACVVRSVEYGDILKAPEKPTGS